MIPYKQPLSVLVVIHTSALDVLLLERSAHPGYWQSVTGSREQDEPLIQTAHREVQEETGIIATPGSACSNGKYRIIDWQCSNTYEIFPEWRHRYGPGITHNQEHVFSLELPEPFSITPAPDEHRAWRWLPWKAAAEACFSSTNREAILALPARTGCFAVD